MNKIISLIFVPLKNKYKNYLFIVIGFMISLIIILFSYKTLQEEIPINISKNDLYVTCPSNINENGNLIESVTDSDNVANKLPLNIDLSIIKKFKLKDKPSENLFKQVNDITLYKKKPTFSIMAGNVDDSLLNNKMQNFSYNIQSIKKGNYPLNNQVLIPELYAQYLLNTKYSDLTKYNDLIGKEVILDVYNKDINLTISGIYTGDNILYTTINTLNSYNINYITTKQKNEYFTFNSVKQKKEYIKEENIPNKCFIDSSSNTINYKRILLILYSMLMLILIIVFLKDEIKYDWYRLNYYGFKLINLMYFLPLVLIFLIFLTIYSFVIF